MAVRTIDDRFINWSETGEAITDEVHTPDASEYNLRHDAWSALTIYTGAGETGTQLVLDTDYQIDTARTLTNAFGDTISVNTAVQIINATYQDTTLYHNYTAHADFQKAINMVLIRAGAPEHYSRRGRWKIKGNDTATNRVTIVSPEQVEVEINGWGYWLPTQIEFRVDQVANWDTDTPTDYTIASNRAGKDFYVYAVEPESGYVPSFILSANSTYPSGYTADTSRKVAGFHALCADILTNVQDPEDNPVLDHLDLVYDSHTITGNTHWLTGYEQGDPLPFSLWDLNWKPKSLSPEGQFYDPRSGLWFDIYLPHWDGDKYVSQYGAVIADGDSSPSFHWYNFVELFPEVGKRLPFQHEFMPAALGSPRETNISGSADPNTTGGHTDTAGNRIVSLCGGEDMTGVLYQWGADGGATNDVGSSWAVADTAGTAGSYDNLHGIGRGQHYEAPNRPLLGMYWSGGAKCGSRGSNWSTPALLLAASRSARGVAEPYGGRA